MQLRYQWDRFRSKPLDTRDYKRVRVLLLALYSMLLIPELFQQSDFDKRKPQAKSSHVPDSSKKKHNSNPTLLKLLRTYLNFRNTALALNPTRHLPIWSWLEAHFTPTPHPMATVCLEVWSRSTVVPRTVMRNSKRFEVDIPSQFHWTLFLRGCVRCMLYHAFGVPTTLGKGISMKNDLDIWYPPPVQYAIQSHLDYYCSLSWGIDLFSLRVWFNVNEMKLAP